MKHVATLGTTRVVYLKEVPEVLGDLFWSVWANRTYGATPDITVGPRPVPDNVLLFALGDDEDGLCGGVLVDEMNRTHGRLALHVAVMPGKERKGHAWRGLLVVGATLCDSFGYERISTYSFPGAPGATVAEAMGLKPEGRMQGFTLTPEGRKDMLVLGGLWSRLKKQHATEISKIQWETPNGIQDDNRKRVRDIRPKESAGQVR